MIYLDNTLIYSNNMSKHHQYVKKVLKHLHKAGLYAKAEKCEFHSELVEYLGYILSPSGLTMSDNKVKIIQDWPELKKVKDIQFFLGFANFTAGLSSTTWILSFYWHVLPGRTFLESLTPPVKMLSTLSRKYLLPYLFSLIEFPMLNSLWKPMLWTMPSLQSSQLLMKIMKFIQLLFTPILLL